jgi:hypothetical protein
MPGRIAASGPGPIPLLPFVAYGTLTASALAAKSHLQEALFGVGAAVLLLFLIGIHNDWNAVMYHVFRDSRG